MSIVQHCATFLYSLFPPYPLLTAPTPRLMLPAPRVSGLICAPQVKTAENIVVEKYTALQAMFDDFFAEQDARLERLLQEASERQRQRLAEVEARIAARKHQRELDNQERRKQ